MNDNVTSHRGSLVLFEQEADNMHSDWIDQIIVSRSTRGKFSVTARKCSDDAGQVKHRRWVTYERLNAIRDVKELVIALERCEASLGINLDWAEVVSTLATLDWVTAAVIAVERELPLPSKTTSSPHDLVGLVMRRHGVTKEQALEMLKEQGM